MLFTLKLLKIQKEPEDNTLHIRVHLALFISLTMYLKDYPQSVGETVPHAF